MPKDSAVFFLVNRHAIGRNMHKLLRILSDHRIHYLQEVGSTNQYLLTEANKGARHGLAAVSLNQTKGLGRQGRTWLTQEGSIAFSYLAQVENFCPFSQLAISIPCLFAEVLQSFGIKTQIKWPNDILLEVKGSSKKVAGILIASQKIESKQYCVIGIGINFSRPHLPAHVPLPDKMAYLSDSGATPLPNLFVKELIHKLDALGPKSANPIKYYRDNAYLAGKQIVLDCGEKQPVLGEVTGFKDTGALVLRLADGTSRNFFHGDCHLLSAL